MADESTRADVAPAHPAPSGTRYSRAVLLKAGALAAGGVVGAGLVGTEPRMALGAPAFIRKRYRIAIVPKGLDNPVFIFANWGGATRASELGDVEFSFTGPASSDAARQVTVVERLIAAGYDGIGISCNAPEPLVAPINDAIARGIVVMTWDSDSPNSGRSVFYGVDNYKVGALEATWMNKLLAGKTGNIWVLSGDPAAQNFQQRIAGAKSKLNARLKIKGYSYVTDYSIAEAVSEVESIVRANPDLRGFLMVTGWPLFTSSAMPNLAAATRKGLKVVSFDYLPPELRWVAQGTVAVLVGQDYWGWGYQSVQILYQLLQGRRYPAFVPQASPVVTQANVAQYIHKWQVAQDAAGAASVFKEPPIPPL